MSNPAETYEAYMVPTFFDPWAGFLIQAGKPVPGERVLDVATGTGIVARRVARLLGPNGRVIGIDLNRNMLTVARTAAEREGLAIEWREGRAEDLPFPDGSFDLVLCQAGLMFFAERNAALFEMRRVLAAGGRAVISVLQGIEKHPFYRALNESIRRRLGTSGIEEIFSLGDIDEMRLWLANAGFQRVDIEPVSLTARFPEPAMFLAGEIDVDTAAIPSMQHLDMQARQALIADIREEMEPCLRQITDGNHVVMPFHTYIVRAAQ